MKSQKEFLESIDNRIEELQQSRQSLGEALNRMSRKNDRALEPGDGKDEVKMMAEISKVDVRLDELFFIKNMAQ